LPEPDVIFVALGSGGTAAGIAVGLEIEQLRSQLVAVCVADPPWAAIAGMRLLARKTSQTAGLVVSSEALSKRVRVESTFLGRGYGYPTVAGSEAIARAAAEGLTLEDTYTGKTFAAALEFVTGTPDRTVLFWNTLSSASLDPLLLGAPAESDLPAGIKRLLL
jgi:1-aminocyclopropane-1-carboxylate deaminase/D-cysteine desulfhydrase-like pyridoxal-dependent ACC family enzyme